MIFYQNDKWKRVSCIFDGYNQKNTSFQNWNQVFVRWKCCFYNLKRASISDKWLKLQELKGIFWLTIAQKNKFKKWARQGLSFQWGIIASLASNFIWFKVVLYSDKYEIVLKCQKSLKMLLKKFESAIELD